MKTFYAADWSPERGALRVSIHETDEGTEIALYLSSTCGNASMQRYLSVNEALAAAEALQRAARCQQMKELKEAA